MNAKAYFMCTIHRFQVYVYITFGKLEILLVITSEAYTFRLYSFDRPVEVFANNTNLTFLYKIDIKGSQ